MCHQGESDCPPTDVDIRVMIGGFCGLGNALHGRDTVQERAEFH